MPSDAQSGVAPSPATARLARQASHDGKRDLPRSYRSGMQKAANGTGQSLASTADSAYLASTAALSMEPSNTRSPPWEVQDFESRPNSEDQEVPSHMASPAFGATGATQLTATASAGWDWSDSSCWWGERAEWIQTRAGEILAAYNFFFEHIGLRKGWRTAPFQFAEVQAPFQAAAEVVVVVRARLDAERGGMLVLRQVEGSAMNFLWSWSPSRPPGSSHKALEDFFRGLVFATLSDGRGLVEGLDSTTVESYVCRHPLLTSEEAVAAAAAEAAAAGAGAEPAAEATGEAIALAAESGEAAAGAAAVSQDSAVDGEAPPPPPATACR